MSIKSEFERIDSEINDIKTALSEKGISASSHKLADFDDDIRQIGVKPYKKRISCVVTTGNYFYNTGLYPNSNWDCKGVFRFDETGTNLGVFGCRDGTNTTTDTPYALYVYTSSNSTLTLMRFGKSVSTPTSTANTSKTIRKVSVISNVLTVTDGLKNQTGTATAATGTADGKVMPFSILTIATRSLNSSGVETSRWTYPIFKGALYAFSIYDRSTGKMIRDYIPVLDNNNKACLYDNVTNTLLYHRQGQDAAPSGDISYEE